MLSPVSTTSASSSRSSGSAAFKSTRNIKDSSIFKVPKIVRKRKKMKILDEETYIEKIGAIIQRDFFPNLDKLKAQNEYIEAVEQNDRKKMKELYEKYSFEQPKIERLASPATFETPIHDTMNCNDTHLLPESRTIDIDNKKDLKLGLDEFLSKNTSEDNASFEEILFENEKKHRSKYAWLFKPETEPHHLSIKNSIINELAIKKSGKNQLFKIDTWSYKNKNYIMYVPDGVELTLDEKIEFAKKKQKVIHINTRLKVNPFNDQQNQQTLNEMAKAQSKVNDGKIGVDGKEIIQIGTPRINGYSIVTTPSPIPVEILDSPIMTWGHIEGTPFKLDGSDTPLLRANSGPSFKMAEPPKREKIAMQLVEKASERMRDKKIKALNAARRSFATPSPKSRFDRINTMSPAARVLATQKLRLCASPSPCQSSLKTPLSGIKIPNTPITPQKKIRLLDIGSKSQPVLTDNLLNLPNLPQRKRAADFFND